MWQGGARRLTAPATDAPPRLRPLFRFSEIVKVCVPRRELDAGEVVARLPSRPRSLHSARRLATVGMTGGCTQARVACPELAEWGRDDMGVLQARAACPDVGAAAVVPSADGAMVGVIIPALEGLAERGRDDMRRNAQRGVGGRSSRAPGPCMLNRHAAPNEKDGHPRGRGRS